jgi:translation elongation factor P/translation initiation factor 5A
MKKKASELKQGNKINLFGKRGIIEKVAISDIGKQGKRKVRLEVDLEGEKSIMVRPEDYPFEVED